MRNIVLVTIIGAATAWKSIGRSQSDLYINVSAADFASAANETLADRQESDDEFHDPNWDLLNFEAFTDRQIESVELVFTGEDRKTLHRFHGVLANLTPVDISIMDREELSIAETCLDGEHCLRPIMARGVRGGSSGGGLPVGEIHIKTSNESFLIGLTLRGFALESRNADFSNVFFSASFTEFLRDIYLRKCNRDLPWQLVEALSGRVELRESEALHRRLRAKTKH